MRIFYSQRVARFFHFLNGFCQRAGICNFNKIQFTTFFFFVLSYFGVRPKEPLPVLKLWIFSLVFCSIILTLACKVWTILSSVLWIVWVKSQALLFLHKYPFFLTQFVKNICFSYKTRWPHMWRSISVISILFYWSIYLSLQQYNDLFTTFENRVWKGSRV